ncbi:MAG: HEAT repeat domain-containing protein [Crocinitomicaceae bacterium]|nr:HEAT repeat domain-containing protein [Crocinitomicaceae bacterium]
MELEKLFKDKLIKPKQRVEAIVQWLNHDKKNVNALVDFAQKSKDPVKASCIEAIEYATKTDASFCNEKAFDFVSASLSEKSPAIKREAGRVIGNTAKLFEKKLEKALTGLLNNSEHEGTVVRWSAAFAIGEIIKLKTNLNKDLIPVAEAICEREEKNSIKKIYLAAIKKCSQ